MLVRSRRRCALCFGLKGEFSERIGQIAHIDQSRSNDSLDNLVWLCFDHHSLFDSSTSQHKNYQAKEVKHHRDRLYTAIATSAISGPESMGRYVATESEATIIWLPTGVAVVFDWPLRCAPTLHFHPRDLVPEVVQRFETLTPRGFQIVTRESLDQRTFAFFADASPTEYREEAARLRDVWRAELGDATAN